MKTKNFLILVASIGIACSHSSLAFAHGGGGGHGGGGWGGHGGWGGGYHGGWGGGGRFGFYYGAPFYPYYGYGYGYPYMPPAVVTVPTQPPVYIQQPAPQPQVNESNYWHYCTNPEGYYPYVKECPGGWQLVAPTPPQQ